MINIVDYVQLCSESLLCIIDNDFYLDDKFYIYLDFSNKQLKEQFQYYLKSQLLSKHQYGCFNIVVNSCNPKENWRKIDNDKYIITDDSIKIILPLFEAYAEKCFIELSKNITEFNFIQNEEVDFIDTKNIIQKLYGYIPTKNKQFWILENGNNVVEHTIDVPRYIFQRVESSLLTLK